MPRPKWKPEDQLTPFARLVRAWMWRQSPPMTVSGLADQTDIAKQTIWGWLNHDAMPRRDTVLQLARATGLDADELLRAAGLPDTRQSAIERRGAMRVVAAVTRRIEHEWRNDPRIPPDAVDAMIAALRSRAPEALEAALSALSGTGLGDTGEEPETPASGPTAPTEASESAPDDSHPRRRRTTAGARH